LMDPAVPLSVASSPPSLPRPLCPKPPPREKRIPPPPPGASHDLSLPETEYLPIDPESSGTPRPPSPPPVSLADLFPVSCGPSRFVHGME
ncbi:hypothetical protein KI387_029597, partial [Taxus chinensis]